MPLPCPFLITPSVFSDTPIVFRFLSSDLCYDSSVMPLLTSIGDRVILVPYIIWLTSNISTFQYFSSFESEWDLFFFRNDCFFLHFTKHWVFEFLVHNSIYFIYNVWECTGIYTFVIYHSIDLIIISIVVMKSISLEWKGFLFICHVLYLVCPMLPLPLPCPFLITPSVNLNNYQCKRLYFIN
jgi:hypothetical protein